MIIINEANIEQDNKIIFRFHDNTLNFRIQDTKEIWISLPDIV